MTPEPPPPATSPPTSQPAPAGNDAAAVGFALGLVALVLGVVPALPIDFFALPIGATAVAFGAAGASRSRRLGGDGRTLAVVGIVSGGLAILALLLWIGPWPMARFGPSSAMLHGAGSSASMAMTAEPMPLDPMAEPGRSVAGSGAGELRVGDTHYDLALDSCELGGFHNTIEGRGTATSDADDRFTVVLISDDFAANPINAIVLGNGTTQVLHPEGGYSAGASGSGRAREAEFEGAVRDVLADEVVEVSLTVRCRE